MLATALYLSTALAALPASVNWDTTPVEPPGGQIIGTLIQWGMYILLGAGVLGFIIAAILLALSPASSHQHGVGKKVAQVGIAMIIGSSAVLLVQALFQ